MVTDGKNMNKSIRSVVLLCAITFTMGCIIGTVVQIQKNKKLKIQYGLAHYDPKTGEYIEDEK